jgi:hypothetical protein
VISFLIRRTASEEETRREREAKLRRCKLRCYIKKVIFVCRKVFMATTTTKSLPFGVYDNMKL